MTVENDNSISSFLIHSCLNHLILLTTDKNNVEKKMNLYFTFSSTSVSNSTEISGFLTLEKRIQTKKS